MGDDPPYLTVGTEVSAKYRGAFCEAKIRKVVRVVKCKVTYKAGLGSTTVSDDLIKGDLRVGSVVEAKHSDRNAFVEATINKIQDCSQYTVVFDDGDITTLRRSALCLKSGRHFNESETLDQLPLTHPEHFSNPVVGGRRGVRRRVANNDDNENESSDEEETPTKKGRKKVNKEADMGKVVCVESSDKKKSKDFWFPALIVSPSAQETVRIRIRDEYLVRSFKDGRYYTVPKKETTDFTKESTSKAEHSSSLLRSACDKAVQYLEKNELPTHWDRDVLFGHTNPSNSDDAVSESEMSDDDPREDKDRFVAQLYKFMDERQTPINKVPTVCNRDLDLYNLYKIVTSKGGYNKVTNSSQWKPVTIKMGYGTMPTTSTINLIKQSYKKMLHNFEEFNRKLGCSLSSLSCRQPTTSSGKSRSNRSLFRDRLGSVAPKETKKSEDPPKVELEFGPPSIETVGSDEQVDNETESVISEQETKIREESLERQEEPRRSRSRLDSRSTKKDSDDSSEKAEKPLVKQKRVSKKKDSITSIESREREGAQTPISASPSPAPSSTGGKRGRGKPPKKKEVEIKVEVEIKSDPDESPDHIGKSVKLSVGDKVQVYYGPKSKGNVTYKAKVIEARIRESIPEFLVHYTGWNNRYDEWITRNRIASVTGSTGGKSSTDNGDNDNDSSSSKTTPKLTPKRKGRPLGSTNKAKLAGRRPQGKDELKKKAEKSSPEEGQSGSDSDGETSDSDEKQQMSTPPSSVSSTGSSAPAPKSARSKRPAEDDDASSGSSSTSSSAPVAKALKREGDGAPNLVIKSEPSPSPPVIDLNVIRSEMKGIDKIIKGSSVPAAVTSTSDTPAFSGSTSKLTSTSVSGSAVTLATNDVKLDIYEFQEDFNDAPGLKMYSPRSPDKKEDVHSAKGVTPDADRLSGHTSAEESSSACAKESTVVSKTESNAPVIAAYIKEEPGKGLSKESKAAKPKKEVKTGPKTSAEGLETPAAKIPQKKVSTKVWNPSTIATATPATLTMTPVTSVPTSIMKTVTSGGLLTSTPIQQTVSKAGLVMKTPLLQNPTQLQRQRANISSPPPPLIPSAVSISPKGPTVIQPRPVTAISPPMPSLIQRPVLSPAVPVVSPIVTHFQPFRTSTEVSVAPVIVSNSTAVTSSPVSSVITTAAVTPSSIVIRTSGDSKPVFTPRQQDMFSQVNQAQQQTPITVSIGSTSIASSGMPPITVVTPSGQIIHSPHSTVSVSVVDSSKSISHLPPITTLPTVVPPPGRVSPYFSTPTKKSPVKRKNPVQMDKSLSPAASGGSSLSKIDPTHLPPKKKVKKVITKNIIDVHQDEFSKEPKVESPEKKPRKPAKKRIKQDGLLDFDKVGSNLFVKSPSKSPKKKKTDSTSPISATKSKSGTAPPYLPLVTTTSFAATTISSVGSVVATTSPHTFVSSTFDKIPPPLELQLSGTIRAETSTGPKIDVKLVKCSTVQGIRIPEKKYAPKMSSESSARMSASIESVSKFPQEASATVEDKVTMTRIYPHKPGKFEYITITASDRSENSSTIAIAPSPSPPTIAPTPKPSNVIHASISDTRIVTESEHRDLTVSAYTSKPGQSTDTYSFKDDSAIKLDVKPVTIVPITRDIRPEVTITKSSPACIVSSTATVVVKTEVKQEPIDSLAPTPAASLATCKPDVQDTTKVNVVSIKVSTERPSAEGKASEDAGTTIPVVSIKEVDMSGKDLEPCTIKDEEESCHSLLCEEIIPGSPPPGVDSSFFGVDDENSRIHSPGSKETTNAANTDDADGPPLLEKSGGSSSKPSFSARFGNVEKADSSKPSNTQPRGSKDNAKGSEGKSFGVGFLENFRAGGNKDSFSSDMFSASAKSKLEPASRFNQNSSDRPPASGNQNHSPLVAYDGRGSSQNLQNVIDNTPPTTPESSSLSSGSPRVDGGRVSPSNDPPSSNKSKDSSDIDSMDPKRDEANEEESSSDAGRKSKDASPSKKLDHCRMSRTLSPPGKRKRVQRRRSPDEVIRSYASYRSRGMSSRKSNSDKDSDHGKIAPPPPPVNLTKPPISKKFNLIPDLDDGMDPEHRIQVLQQALQSIRDKYHEVRSELSSEERRLKRYKRRQKEREKEKSKQAQKTS